MKLLRKPEEFIRVTINDKNSSMCVQDVKQYFHGKKSKWIILESAVHYGGVKTFMDLFKGLSQKQMASKFYAMIVTEAKRIIGERNASNGK